jgi:beta-carotene hydroxylase
MLLRHRADRLSIAYFLAYVALVVADGLLAPGGLWFITILCAILAVGLTNIAHHHAHRAMWLDRRGNRATDIVLSAVMGVPMFVFPASHIRTHHRGLTRGTDTTHPSRFGDDNHFLGMLAHPFRVLPIVGPDLATYVARGIRRPSTRALIIAQLVAPIALAAVLVAFDPYRWAMTVLIPQLVGIHVLLAANYFQHAHTDPTAPFTHSRSFLGTVNRVWFNIGYHAAHHQWPRAHWSELPECHARLASSIPSQMVEQHFLAYIWRTLIVLPLATRRRTH